MHKEAGSVAFPRDVVAPAAREVTGTGRWRSISSGRHRFPRSGRRIRASSGGRGFHCERRANGRDSLKESRPTVTLIIVSDNSQRRHGLRPEVSAGSSNLAEEACRPRAQAIPTLRRRTDVEQWPEDARRVEQIRPSLAEFMASSPLVGVELDLKHDQSLPRDVDL